MGCRILDSPEDDLAILTENSPDDSSKTSDQRELEEPTRVRENDGSSEPNRPLRF